MERILVYQANFLSFEKEIFIFQKKHLKKKHFQKFINDKKKSIKEINLIAN